MNPKIIKFWEDAGYQVIDNFAILPYRRNLITMSTELKGYDFWDLYKDNVFVTTIAIRDRSETNIQYCFERVIYSEEQMLRIVNMKVFT